LKVRFSGSDFRSTGVGTGAGTSSFAGRASNSRFRSSRICIDFVGKLMYPLASMVIPLLYLFRQSTRAGRSNASLRFEQAQRYGTPFDRWRESARRTLRVLFGSWVFLSLAIMVLLDLNYGGREDQNAYMGMFFAFVLVLPGYCLFRLMRFVLGY